MTTRRPPPTMLLFAACGLLAAAVPAAAVPVTPQGPATEPTATETRLAPDLAGFEPFLGHTWKGLVDADNEVYDVSRWEPALAGRAVRIVHSVADGAYGGETLIMVDPATGTIEFTYFTTAGFHTKGTMRFDADGVLHTHERVHGDGSGPSEVEARMERTGDGALQVTTRMRRNGKWEERQPVLYRADPSAKVILPTTVAKPKPTSPPTEP